MRLGQLSRQLDVDSKKIVKFLNKENIDVADNPNTKLEDDQIKLVEDHFFVEEVVEIEVKEEPSFQSILDIEPEKESEPESQPKVETEAEPIPASPEVEAPEESIEEKKEVPTKIDLSKFETKKPIVKIESPDGKNFFPAEDPQEDEITEAELLPTEIVKLEGIKVVGKIDLPEKPKKENKKGTKKEDTVVAEVKTEDESSPVSETPVIEEDIDETHPLKKAKLVGIKEREVVKRKVKSTTQLDPKKQFKGIKAKDIKAKKKAEEKKNPKKKKKEFLQKKEDVVNINREARQRKKDRQKDAVQNKQEKGWLAKLWESFSL